MYTLQHLHVRWVEECTVQGSVVVTLNGVQVPLQLNHTLVAVHIDYMYILRYCPEWLGIIGVVILMKFPSQLENNNNQTFW